MSFYGILRKPYTHIENSYNGLLPLITPDYNYMKYWYYK